MYLLRIRGKTFEEMTKEDLQKLVVELLIICQNSESAKEKAEELLH